MTRINTVDPSELCDQHLLAEHRELTRIPNGIVSGKFRVNFDQIPAKYTVRTEGNPDGGKGHVTFFFDKLDYLYWRYIDIMAELRRRGFQPVDRWPYDIVCERYAELYGTWKPDQEAIELNRKRIRERMPQAPRYAGRYVTM